MSFTTNSLARELFCFLLPVQGQLFHTSWATGTDAEQFVFGGFISHGLEISRKFKVLLSFQNVYRQLSGESLCYSEAEG